MDFRKPPWGIPPLLGLPRWVSSMSGITLRVLDGSDRGRVFTDLRAPITIGREEGNDVQLNDERVSRFHLKIQEDNERLVLTDLESTNGTKVNGEDIKLRILRYGDQISLGRSVLLFGSRDEISRRLAKLNGQRSADSASVESNSKQKRAGAAPAELDIGSSADADDLQARLFDLEPPELPARLSPGQAAQLSEVLEYLHIRLRELICGADVDPKGDRSVFDARHWQNMLDLQSRLAEYLRLVSDPNDGHD